MYGTAQARATNNRDNEPCIIFVRGIKVGEKLPLTSKRQEFTIYFWHACVSHAVGRALFGSSAIAAADFQFHDDNSGSLRLYSRSAKQHSGTLISLARDVMADWSAKRLTASDVCIGRSGVVGPRPRAALGSPNFAANMILAS